MKNTLFVKKETLSLLFPFSKVIETLDSCLRRNDRKAKYTRKWMINSKWGFGGKTLFERWWKTVLGRAKRVLSEFGFPPRLFHPFGHKRMERNKIPAFAGMTGIGDPDKQDDRNSRNVERNIYKYSET